MAIKEYIVNSTSEFVSTVSNLKSDFERLWFRGHASKMYHLQPKVYRSPYSWEDEQPLLHQFKAKAARFVTSKPDSDIEWLFIMQHHATPTRLLDWSEAAMVALAFAIQYRNESHIGNDAAVWCLDPKRLNSFTRFSSFDSEPIPNICANEDLQNMLESSRQKYPVAIIGPQNTDRIIAQKGVFTLFPNAPSFSMEELDKSEEFLRKIIINEAAIDEIKKELYFLGMTESTLFPELDSISKELRSQYERS